MPDRIQLRRAAGCHPFNVGFGARVAGKTEYDNPHQNTDWQWSAWRDGWENADECCPPLEDPAPETREERGT